MSFGSPPGRARGRTSCFRVMSASESRLPFPSHVLPSHVRFRVMSTSESACLPSHVLPSHVRQCSGGAVALLASCRRAAGGAHGARKGQDAAMESGEGACLARRGRMGKTDTGGMRFSQWSCAEGRECGKRRAVRTFADDEREDNGGDLDDQGQEGHHGNPVGCDEETDIEMRERTRNGNIFALTERRACPEMTGDIRFRKHIVL
jgi:hypothetical protein